MKTLKVILRITLIAVIIAIVFVSIQRRGISLDNTIVGSIHGSIIGLTLGSIISIKQRYLNYITRRIPFLVIIVFNSILYLLGILFGRAIAMTITNGRKFQMIPDDDPHFAGAVFFIFGTILIYNLLEQISLLTGRKQLFNFAVGKYSNAQVESRMIMFIDMVDSTKTAEKIGDSNYLSLLDEFFSLMTIPLGESRGEIYKYIGDEAIITWNKNLQDADIPLAFFYKFKKAIRNHSKYFEEKYGLVPKFRAGLHYGSMMIGELGSAKKEIALIGDSLNTASRILDVGKKLQQEFVISELLGKQLINNHKYVTADNLGKQTIKGKEDALVLFSIRSKKSAAIKQVIK